MSEKRPRNRRSGGSSSSNYSSNSPWVNNRYPDQYSSNPNSQFTVTPWLQNNNGFSMQAGQSTNGSYSSQYAGRSQWPSNTSAGYGNYNSNFSSPSFQRNDQHSDEILKELGKCMLNNLKSGNVPGGFTMPSGAYPPYQQRVQNYGYNRPNFYSGQPDKRRNYSNGEQGWKKVKLNQSNGDKAKSNQTTNGTGPKQRTRPVKNAKKEVTSTSDNSSTNNTSQQTPQTKTLKAKVIERKGIGKSIKNRYPQLTNNPHLSEDEKIAVGFMRQLLYSLNDKKDPHTHCFLLSPVILGHRNAVKLMRHELKLKLDQVHGAEDKEEIKEKKLKFLNEERVKIQDELKRCAPESNDEMDTHWETIMTRCVEELVTPFSEEMIPTPQDFVIDPAVTPSAEEVKKELQYQLVTYVYNELGYGIHDAKASLDNKLKFHLGNQIIPLLLIEMVQKKRNPRDELKLPTVFTKVLNFKNPRPFMKKKEMTISQSLFNAEKAAGGQLQTDIRDLLPLEKSSGDPLSANVVRDLSSAIIIFDVIATTIRNKLLNYTPHIVAEKQVKEEIWDEFVKNVYVQTLDCLKNYKQLYQRKIEPLQCDSDVSESANSDAKAMEVDSVAADVKVEEPIEDENAWE